jgi:3-phenylpropionate/cinnamic acid dioxygenase small subunit
MLAYSQQQLAELVARQAIEDCLRRYARGVDRHDDELILSAYHDDATHQRGSFTGSPQDFIDWSRARHVAHTRAHLHYVTNVCINFTSAQAAHVESYYLAVSASKDGTDVITVSGRYIDRFEARDGEWRIAGRLAVGEIRARGQQLPSTFADAGGTWDRSDPSYERPSGQ